MKEELPYRYKHPHPAVTVDLAIFRLVLRTLQVLLIERGRDPFEGQWALPGGFVRLREGLAEGAQRELNEETGLSQIYLEQVGAFGEPERDPRERVISVAFYAIIGADKAELQAGSDARKAAWHSIESLPRLAFDHNDILAAARKKLSDKINRTTIAVEFLPPEFTLTELQEVFEAVRGESIDKRNFRKWADTFSYIRPTGRMRRGGQHRPAALYRASGKALALDSALVAESPERSKEAANAAGAAYRKGYEDALAAMHRSVLEAEKRLLKSLR
jgi:8-oxo-dGTP diphosphatase